MPNESNTEFTGVVTLAKQNGTVLTLGTNQKYVDKNLKFEINAPDAVVSASSASADVNIDSTDDGQAGGINISGSIGAKTTTEPSSGYYIRLNASGSVDASVTSGGWVTTGQTITGSGSSTKFFPIDAGSVTTSGGGLSNTSNYSGTPTVDISIDSQTTSGVTITNTTQSSGYYIKLTGESSPLSGTTTVTRAPVTDVRTAGYIPARSSTTVIYSDTSSPTVTVNKGSKTKYLVIPSGSLSASISSNSDGGASMAATGFTPSNSATSYYVTLSTTPGYVKAKADVATGGYVSNQTNESSAVNVGVGGNGTKVYIPAGSTTQNAPTVDTSTGVVTATSTVTTGYQSGDTKSNTLYLPTVNSSTVSPTETEQTAVPANKYTLGAVKVGAISSTYVGSGVSRKSSSDMSADGATVTAPAGYYAEDAKKTISSTTITEGTTTVSSSTAIRGTWSQTEGYTSSRTIGASTFANTATSGQTYVDISGTTAAPVLVAGDYLYINKGWTDNLKISLAKLVPDGSDVKGHGEYILSGHSAYDNDGTLVAGTIQTMASTDISVNGKTVTVPVGYYTGATGGTPVSVNIAEGSYSAAVTSADISVVPTFTPSTSGTVSNISTMTKPSGTDGTDYWTITPDGSATNGNARSKAKATVTAGYVEAGSATTSYNNVAITPTLNDGTPSYIPKASISGSSTNATATTTVAPGDVTIANNTTSVSGKTRIDASPSTASTGITQYYIALKANAAANSTGTTSSITGSGSISVTDAGYAPSSLNGSVSISGTATAKTSSKDSSVYYVPLASAALTASATAGATTTVAPGDVTIANNTTSVSGKTRIDASPSTSTTGIGTYYIALKANAAANTTGTTSDISGTAYAGCSAAGWAPATLAGSGSVTGTATAKTSSKDSSVYYVPVASGAYSASVSSHSVTTPPVVTGSISGTVTNIGTTTKPSGTDGTNYWTITPSGSVTTTGVSTAKGKATIGTTGYIASGNKESSANTVDITPTVNNGSARYIVKGSITNNTSGGTSTATINRGKQIKIGAGYYPNDLYYTAQSNSGTLTIDTTNDANANISCSGYANVNVTGINIPIPSSGTSTFSIKVPNGSSTATFTFKVDSTGNVTITES